MNLSLFQPGIHRATFNFAYLNLRNHPRGVRMLENLLAAGFRPSIVIEEDSTLAKEGFDAQLAVLDHAEGFVRPKHSAQLCASHGVTYRLVANHNGEDTYTLLSAAPPDWILLGDTRILRERIFGLAKHGALNTHPGYLPEVRGNHPYIWAIIDDLPQGASVHLLDVGVDTGPLIRAEQLHLPSAGISFNELVFQLNEQCARLLTSVTIDLVERGVTAVPQASGTRSTYRAAPPHIRQQAIDHLNKGRGTPQGVSPTPPLHPPKRGEFHTT